MQEAIAEGCTSFFVRWKLLGGSFARLCVAVCLFGPPRCACRPPSLPAQNQMEGLLLPPQHQHYRALKKEYVAAKAACSDGERKEWRRRLEKYVLRCMTSDAVPANV